METRVTSVVTVMDSETTSLLALDGFKDLEEPQMLRAVQNEIVEISNLVPMVHYLPNERLDAICSKIAGQNNKGRSNRKHLPLKIQSA